MKINEIVPFAEMWIELETIKNREVGQKQKKNHTILLIYGIQGKKWYSLTYLQSRNRDTNVSKVMDIKELRGGWHELGDQA